MVPGIGVQGKDKALEILVEDLDGGLWVAAIGRGNRLEGLDIDPPHEEVRFGSIYWGRVERIDKALDAAFVDLDGDNTGVLFNADVRLLSRDGKVIKGGTEEISKVLRPGQMVAVQAKSGYLLREGDESVVMEDKLPHLSMDITIPGRYLIYSPLMEGNRISSRIRDRKLRRSLHKMLNATENIQGCILRAAAVHTQTDILRREGQILKRIWEQLQEHLSGDETALIMSGPDAVQRVLGDHAGQTIDSIRIVTMDLYQHTEEWCEIYAPDLVTKIHPVELANPHADLALFDFYDVTGQIEDLFQPYAVLEKGGNIIIQKTAALTAIDVNRGSDTRRVLEVNLDAAREIARHLRLRNLGGIVIVDFLKMKTRKERVALTEALQRFFEKDPCTVQVHGLTGLGLMEVTRKRRTPSLQDRLDVPL